jgi:hypothetical protein
MIFADGCDDCSGSTRLDQGHAAAERRHEFSGCQPHKEATKVPWAIAWGLLLPGLHRPTKNPRAAPEGHGSITNIPMVCGR